MKVAEILSDLTSLKVCGHNEALALVSVHKTSPNQGESDATDQPDQSPRSQDLQRAKDLVELHNDVTLKQLNSPGGGLNEELRKARRDVSRVLHELKAQGPA
ncbi:hypothetical protein FQN52_006906 [Onygenales sp. PD_12]|nr:hypothetical protein FQN53_005557 [Emmonsiellopsis sp. PD_33]KAK2788069.1 hypothetical protein FQN52_006906 [Onygenales sp. PD_12]KAK2805397.1 hypothetical protein FQN51_000223 [Onygenales sp. PD_10]